MILPIDTLKEEFVQQCFDQINDLHMLAYHATSTSKQLTADAKENMNEKRFELQDVMYERKHILEEIVKCRGFR